MKLADFKLGSRFTCGDPPKTWLCTDIGDRVVVAICVSDAPKDESWLKGPPYALAEVVFDENDQRVCKPVSKRK